MEREGERMCSSAIHHLSTRRMGKHRVVPPAPIKGLPIPFTKRNKTKVARTKQRLHKQRFLSSLRFKCCISRTRVNQYIPLYNWLPFFFLLFFAQCRWQEETWKIWKAGEKTLMMCQPHKFTFYLLQLQVSVQSQPEAKLTGWLCVQACRSFSHSTRDTTAQAVMRYSDGARGKGKRSGDVVRGMTWSKSMVPYGYPRMGNHGKANMPR